MPVYLNTASYAIREQEQDILPGALVTLYKPVESVELTLVTDAPYLETTPSQSVLSVTEFYKESVFDFKTKAALGYLPGVTIIKKFGYNPNIGTSYETIWVKGGLYEYMTTASKLYLASTSNNDTLLGKSGEIFFDSAVREFGSNVFAIKRRVQAYENSFGFTNSIPFIFDEKADIEIRGKALTVAAPGSAGFDIILIRKTN